MTAKNADKNLPFNLDGKIDRFSLGNLIVHNHELKKNTNIINVASVELAKTFQLAEIHGPFDQ